MVNLRNEDAPFEGDYSGRDWLNETPQQSKDLDEKARLAAKAREYKRKNRPTMTHQEARNLELSGRAVHVMPRNKLVRVDGCKLYRLV